MTLTDQAEFVIADNGIHRGLVAWKLAASSGNMGAVPRIFTLRHPGLFAVCHDGAANTDATPTNRQRNLKPIQRDRSAFGGLKPVHTGPKPTG